MFKKLKWYFFYKRILRENKDFLFKEHGIKIDWINRMYKTYTLTKEDLENVKVYGRKYVTDLIEKDKNKIEKSFINLNIHEFVGLMELEPLNKSQIGIAFRYKYIDIAKMLNRIIWLLVTITLILISWYFIPKIFSIGIGLIATLVIYLISRLFVIDRIQN